LHIHHFTASFSNLYHSMYILHSRFCSSEPVTCLLFLSPKFGKQHNSLSTQWQLMSLRRSSASSPKSKWTSCHHQWHACSKTFAPTTYPSYEPWMSMTQVHLRIKMIVFFVILFSNRLRSLFRSHSQSTHLTVLTRPGKWNWTCTSFMLAEKSPVSRSSRIKLHTYNAHVVHTFSFKIETCMGSVCHYRSGSMFCSCCYYFLFPSLSCSTQSHSRHGSTVFTTASAPIPQLSLPPPIPS